MTALLILCAPVKASSSRFSQICAPPHCSVRRFAKYSGVGPPTYLRRSEAGGGVREVRPNRIAPNCAPNCAPPNCAGLLLSHLVDLRLEGGVGLRRGVLLLELAVRLDQRLGHVAAAKLAEVRLGGRGERRGRRGDAAACLPPLSGRPASR